MAARPRTHKIDIPNLYQRLDKRDGRVYFQYRDPRTGRFHSLGSDKKRAQTIACELNERISQQLLDHYQRLLDQNVPKVAKRGISTKTWCQRYMKLQDERAKNGELADNTIKQRRYCVNLLIERLGQTGIKDIDTKSLAKIIDEYKAQNKLHMAVRIRSTWIDLFKEALHAGEIEGGVNPAAATRGPRLKVSRNRLTKDDWPALVASAKKQIFPYAINSLYLALTTGLRRQDLCNLKFSDIKNGHLLVSISKSRGQTKLAFPLTLTNPLVGMSLGEIIEQCRNTGVLSRYLLHLTTKHAPTRKGKPVSAISISKSFLKLRDESGLTWEQGSAPSFHELRSLAERTYSELGYDTQVLLGHKTRKMTDKYHDTRGSEYTFITHPNHK
ncbi:phage integrase Arm DNA-binding domain-containing protein [Grimontia sp. NTOU-MAR1]|uniref:phage integrase Arm DNA-binding domain-containing protein n=1 Tax=Grimontia sp. NTOU-MAR1 TaxID=3111011 RepID=UPI002DBDF191|nr:phage integrase Arm DNA-binding domain-containing protein [Grimontia sp. NTOU-MAR1]WRV98338.1 phage integrase Arm DNA-binding domain-containing protein [Grimontia sp. NTOU-MAR1]